MVEAYWEIGEQIYIACGKNDRAEYGKGLLKYLSERLTVEFGKGFTIRNLRNMRQFYLTYLKRHTLCTELSWSHYRVLMRIDDENRRNWYTEECAKSGWSVRQLEIFIKLRRLWTSFLTLSNPTNPLSSDGTLFKVSFASSPSLFAGFLTVTPLAGASAYVHRNAKSRACVRTGIQPVGILKKSE